MIMNFCTQKNCNKIFLKTLKNYSQLVHGLNYIIASSLMVKAHAICRVIQFKDYIYWDTLTFIDHHSYSNSFSTNIISTSSKSL